MKNQTISRRASLAVLAGAPLAAQQKKDGGNPYPPDLPGALVETYKTVGDVKMNLWIYNPDGHKPSDRHSAIVFFFGGGWTNGSPKQFEQQCKHFASRGMVAITADYRVGSRHKAKITDCIRDAKSAIRYVRSNAKRLGIDPNRIAAGGGSAGGHLAGATGVISGFEEAGENAKISSRPNALVMFNPALVLAATPEAGVSAEWARGVSERFGGPAESVSPYHQVKKGAPPSLILHGKGDTTVPYKSVEAFTAKMKEAGNRCELEGYEGQPHGFFNHGRGDNEHYRKTLQRADAFLVSLGYLKPS